MPLNVYWDNDQKTIIRCDSSGRWTWEEYHTALEQIAGMMRTVSHRVHMINVEGPNAAMPSGSPKTHFGRAVKVLPDNAGANIMIVKSAWGRAIASLMSKLPGNTMDKIEMFGSVEEAYAFIARQDAPSNP